MKDHLLYVAVDGKVLGPLGRRELALHLAAGGVKGSDQACWAGLDAWMKLADMVDAPALADEGRRALKAAPRIAAKARRFAACLLDLAAFVAVMVVMVPLLAFSCVLVVCRFAGVEQTPHVSAILIVVAFAGVFLAFMFAQLWGLRFHGQTIGKRMAGVRVLSVDGQLPGIGRILLRTFVPPLIVIVPVFGLIWLVVSACLFLFGTSRPLHDRIANTCVVSA
jgi:uncharacterized RDD family membrane protein YckC